MLTEIRVLDEAGGKRAVPADSDGATEGAQAKASAVRLRALRTAQLGDVIRNLAADSVRVALYVLVEPDQDPAGRFTEAQAVAARNGWSVAMTACDDTGMTDPDTRPRLARLYAAVSRGELHGVVAPSRNDLSAFHGIYEDTLHAMRVRGGFLALARDETSL